MQWHVGLGGQSWGLRGDFAASCMVVCMLISGQCSGEEGAVVH